MSLIYNLAYDIGISETSLRRFLKGEQLKNDITDKIRKAVMMKKKEFEELYRKYKTKDLAIMLGVSVPTIYKRIKEAGIKPKGQGKGTRVRKLNIED